MTLCTCLTPVLHLLNIILLPTHNGRRSIPELTTFYCLELRYIKILIIGNIWIYKWLAMLTTYILKIWKKKSVLEESKWCCMMPHLILFYLSESALNSINQYIKCSITYHHIQRCPTSISITLPFSSAERKIPDIQLAFTRLFLFFFSAHVQHQKAAVAAVDVLVIMPTHTAHLAGDSGQYRSSIILKPPPKTWETAGTNGRKSTRAKQRKIAWSRHDISLERKSVFLSGCIYTKLLLLSCSQKWKD